MSNTTKMPKRISCPECKKEGKSIIHTAVVHDLPDGDWTWQLLNHDGTSKFEWPGPFSSQNEAEKHIWDLMTDGDKGKNVV